MATALITGASEGIGLAFGKVLADKGYDLILVARRENLLQQVAADISERYQVRCHVLPCDLAAPNAATDLFQAVQTKGWEVDFLVNNAGILFNGDFLSTDRRGQERLLQLNIVALTSLTHLFASAMVERGGGHILNVASTAAWISLPGENVYAASKAYVRAFTEALANELDAAKSSVQATALCPGYTDTRMLDNPAQGPKLSIPRFMIMSTDQVARQGIAGCLQGKTTVIPGLSNRLLVALLHVLPRLWVTRIMGRVYRSSFRKK